MAQTSEHLSAENCEQEKEQDSNFEVIRMRRSDLGEIIETACEQNGAANHSGDFEIGQALVIEHSIKFPKADHSEQADQQPKQDLVTCEHDQQRDCPKRDRADKPQNENGTSSDHVRVRLLQRRGHVVHHLGGTNQVQARMSRVLAQYDCAAGFVECVVLWHNVDRRSERRRSPRRC